MRRRAILEVALQVPMQGGLIAFDGEVVVGLAAAQILGEGALGQQSPSSRVPMRRIGGEILVGPSGE